MSEPQPPRAIVWRGPGHIFHAHTDHLLAKILSEVGFTVEWVYCDESMLGCNYRTVLTHPDIANWRDACAECQTNNLAAAGRAGAVPVTLSELTNRRDGRAGTRDGAHTPPPDSDDLERHTRASVTRYLQASPVSTEDGHEEVFEAYRTSAFAAHQAAVQTAATMPDLAVITHGIYVDWGPAFDALRAAGVPVLLWTYGPLPASAFVRRDEGGAVIHPRYPSRQAWDTVARSSLTSEQDSELLERMDAVMAHTRALRRDHFRSTGRIEPSGDLDYAVDDRLAQLGLGPKVWGIFPHLNWDAHHSYEPHLFDDSADWLVQTVAAAGASDVDWIVRVHPAEERLGTRFGARELLQERLGTIPKNVRLIASDDPIDTFELTGRLSGVVTIRGTVGLEATVAGLPAILGGMAHYSHRGFTHNFDSEESYLEAIRSVDRYGKLTGDHRDLARRYAYDYWVRRLLILTDESLDPSAADQSTRSALMRLIQPGSAVAS